MTVGGTGGILILEEQRRVEPGKCMEETGKQGWRGEESENSSIDSSGASMTQAE